MKWTNPPPAVALASDGGGGDGSDGRNGVHAVRGSGSGDGGSNDGKVGDAGSAGSSPFGTCTAAALVGVLYAERRLSFLSGAVATDAAAGALSVVHANYVPGKEGVPGVHHALLRPVRVMVNEGEGNSWGAEGGWEGGGGGGGGCGRGTTAPASASCQSRSRGEHTT